ncbi:MAG: hypothetical protein ACR2QM_03370, partial [Longimicrobiales bacterium]
MPRRSQEGSAGDPGAEAEPSTGPWRDLDDLLERVSSAPRDRREGLLDEACRGDPGLRAELESLLGHVGPAEALFAELSEGLTAQNPPSHSGPGDAPKPGSYIGQYRL